jgi:hypothetical protein
MEYDTILHALLDQILGAQRAEQATQLQVRMTRTHVHRHAHTSTQVTLCMS